jgi:hypothetical protein
LGNGVSSFAKCFHLASSFTAQGNRLRPQVRAITAGSTGNDLAYSEQDLRENSEWRGRLQGGMETTERFELGFTS